MTRASKSTHFVTPKSAGSGSITQSRVRGGRGGLNLDRSGMCHLRLKFTTLFWSGKSQKVYTVLESLLYCIVLYCIVLYCIVLYCIVLYCIVLYCIVLYCIVLYCIVLYCIVLYCIVLYCIVLYCIVLYCIVLYWRQRPNLCFTYLIK